MKDNELRRMNCHYRFRKEERRERAKERAKLSAKRTPFSQIKRLNSRLGKGQGAAKERARLSLLIRSGYGKTPMSDIPKDWYLGKNSKVFQTKCKVKGNFNRKKTRRSYKDKTPERR